MAIYEGTTDDLLRRFGARIRDYTLTVDADGDRVSRTRAMSMINGAVWSVHRKLRNMGNIRCLTREVALTQDATDTTVYYLPAREVGLFHVRDSDTTYYEKISDEWDVSAAGYFVQARAATTGRSIKFQEVSPTGTVYARVLDEPVWMISGTNAATSATSITLPASPLGTLYNTANYYAYQDIVITSGNDAGDIRTITASTIAGVCTVASWTTATPASGTDTFSIKCPLPRQMWDAVVAEAAHSNLATDKEIIEFAEEIRRERDETFLLGLSDLLHDSATLVHEPRQTREYIR